MHRIFTTLVFVSLGACADDDIAFPEKPGQTLDSENPFGRVPLYAPSRCPINQWLYPGGQTNDWICDCQPGFIYYPPKDACFSAFRQGPCSKGYHLIVPGGKVVPKCVSNPCEDGYARCCGKCYEMGKPNGPCLPFEAGGGIFDVNATTLIVECLKGTDRISLFPFHNCPPSGKRSCNNECNQKNSIVDKT